MKTNFLLLLLLLSVGPSCYSITWQVINDGITFSPAIVTIHSGDNVNFSLDPDHNAVEVSSATWNANGATPNGGFSVDFGGGLVSSTELSVGTHYYVCQPHASLGMKAKIVVVTATDVNEMQTSLNITLTPNPARNVIKITTNENAFIGSDYLLFDQLGRQMLTGQLTDKVTAVTVSQLPAGIYFMRITAQHNETYKIMINR